MSVHRFSVAAAVASILLASAANAEGPDGVPEPGDASADSLQDIDRTIELLEAAREQVAGGRPVPIPTCRRSEMNPVADGRDVCAAADPHTASLTITKLQNPVKESFEALNNNLREISKRQKNFGKALEKVTPISRALPKPVCPRSRHALEMTNSSSRPCPPARSRLNTMPWPTTLS